MKRTSISVLAASALVAAFSAAPAGADPAFDAASCHGEAPEPNQEPRDSSLAALDLKRAK